MSKSSVCVLILSIGMTPTCFSNGFYIGAGVGPDTATISKRAHITLLTSNVYDKTQIGMNGTFVSLFTGYGYHYGRAYIAAELNYNASDMQSKSSNYETEHKAYSQTIYKMPGTASISALPGYQFSPIFLPYARLGFAKRHFINDTSDVSLAHFNKWVNGFRYGLGLQTMITQHVDGRLEWSHTNYQTQSMYTITAVTKYTKVTPHSNQYEFSMIYHI